MWSAQDLTQLQGRLVRDPQWKQVICYNLLIGDSIDDLQLHDLSWAKEKMMRMFTYATEKIGT